MQRKVLRDQSHQGLDTQEWQSMLEHAIQQGPDARYQAASPLLQQMLDRNPRIVLCVPEFGRTWQFVQTLPINLAILWPFRRFVTVVLADLNYEFQEEMHRLRDVCQVALHESLLFHFRRSIRDEDGFTHWHASVGKNSGHLCGANVFPKGILVELDCDNFVSPKFIEDIIENSQELLDGSLAGIRWRHPGCPPCTGRTSGGGGGLSPRQGVGRARVRFRSAPGSAAAATCS